MEKFFFFFNEQKILLRIFFLRRHVGTWKGKKISCTIIKYFIPRQTKEPTCNAWETWVQYLGWEDPLEAHEKMLNFSNPQGNGYHFTPFRMAIIKKEKKKEIAVFLVLAWSSHSSTAFDPKAPNHPPHSPHTSAGHAGALWPWGGGRRWSIHEDWGLLGRWCEPDFSQTSLGWGAWGIQGTRVLIIP